MHGPWMGSPIGNSEGVTHHEGFQDISTPQITFPAGGQSGAPEGAAEGINAPTDNAPVPVQDQADARPPVNPNNRPWRNVGSYKDWPAKIQKFQIDGESYDFMFNVDIINEWEHPISSVKNKGR